MKTRYPRLTSFMKTRTIYAPVVSCMVNAVQPRIQSDYDIHTWRSAINVKMTALMIMTRFNEGSE